MKLVKNSRIASLALVALMYVAAAAQQAVPQALPNMAAEARGSAASGARSEPSVAGLVGQPVGSNVIDERWITIPGGYFIHADLVLNDTKDRVGAEATVCSTQYPETQPRDGDCDHVQTMIFSFPQLRYDAASRQVLWGDKIVARHGAGFLWGRSLKLAKGYRLSAHEVAGLRDTGFNHERYTTVQVSLVRGN